MITIRGFEVHYFYDDAGVKCSIQESSACKPHVWFGIADSTLKIMAKDKAEFVETVNNLTKDYPETNECGWCTVKLPREALMDTKMHLNQAQAKKLAKELKYFAKHGRLKCKL